MNKSAGFTVIELMMVTATIGILAAIALPAYQDYVTRAKVAEAFTLVENGKHGVQEYYKEYFRFPSNNEAAGLPAAEKLLGSYVASIEVAEGAIHVVFHDHVSNREEGFGSTLTLRPAVVEGSPLSPMAWVCGYQDAVPGMKAIGENRTDLLRQILPAVCRS